MVRFLNIAAATLLFAGCAIADCNPYGSKSTGFIANFYSFRHGDLSDAYDVNYMTYGYRNEELEYTVPDVTDINFENYSQINGIYYANLYGVNVTLSNFTLELSGYFLAEETGEYNFTMFADDSVYVQFGSGQAFSCCDANTTSISTNYSMYATWDMKSEVAGRTQMTRSLIVGNYYPLKMVYTNAQGWATMKFSAMTPSGKVITDFTNVHNFEVQDNGPTCNAVNGIISTTIPWYNSYTSTTTIIPTSSYISTTIEVFTPAPVTRITSTYTGSETTDVTVSATAVGQTETIIHEVPIPTTTVTSYYSGSGISYSTVSATPGETASVIVFDPTPIVSKTVTYTGSETTDVTVSATAVGQTETIIHEVPIPTTTVTSYYSGSGISYSTVSATPGETASVIIFDPTLAVPSSWVGWNTSTPVTKTATKSKAFDFTSTQTDISTTVLLVTSCSDHACTEVPVTTGYKVITDASSSYTVYCPFSTSTNLWQQKNYSLHHIVLLVPQR